MTSHDKKEFAAILGGMAEVYGKEISKQALALHFKVLEGYGIEEVRAAALAILESRKYTSMPTPADFLQYLGGGSVEDRAEIEADKVLNAIGRIGGYESVVFDDPTTMAVIANAYDGWAKLCQDCGVTESVKWFRHGFIKTWCAYKRQGIAVYGVLPGKHEIANAAAGYAQRLPPSLIGDQDKAARVLKAGAETVPKRVTGAVAFKDALAALPVGRAQSEGRLAPGISRDGFIDYYALGGNVRDGFARHGFRDGYDLDGSSPDGSGVFREGCESDGDDSGGHESHAWDRDGYGRGGYGRDGYDDGYDNRHGRDGGEAEDAVDGGPYV